MDKQAIFEEARARVTDLVKNADVDTPVPTCPGWTVKDVVAHLAASLGTYVAGDSEKFKTATWADDQVEERRGTSLEDVLAEWESNAAEPGDLFGSMMGTVAMSDVLAHEQDIRTAIGRPGQRGGEGVIASIEMGLGWIAPKMGSEIPALRIVTEDIDKTVGEGEPAGTLRTSTYELWRTLHGRRSPAQVRAMDWDGDPETWLGVLFLFGPAENDITE